MEYGLYLYGELMHTYNTSKEAHEAAIFAEDETGIPHEVKTIAEYPDAPEYPDDNVVRYDAYDGCYMIGNKDAMDLIIKLEGKKIKIDVIE